MIIGNIGEQVTILEMQAYTMRVQNFKSIGNDPETSTCP